MKMKKQRLNRLGIAIVFVLIFLIGIGMMVYPIIAARYSETVRSEIQTNYEEVLKEVDTSELDAIRAAAEAYNHNLFSGVFSPLEYEENGYYDQLKLPDTDVMCYVSIPKIDVYLPVYHGVGTKSLDKGAGHMEQSCFPIGGVNTHAVISAHSGMAQSPMFSDLERLKVKDIFQIIVLGETLTYEVDNIDVVLPEQVDSIKIQADKDLVSLVTCTPYGVNSHRLVVTGHRIETPKEEIIQIETTPNEDDTASVWVAQYWKSVKTGATIALGIVLFMTICFVGITFYKKGGGFGKYVQQKRRK